MDNPSLLTLHNALLEAFDLPVPAEPTYFPHLSLVYGDLSSEEKDRIIADLKLAGDVEDLKGSEGETRCKLVGETGYVPTEVLLVR